MKTISKEQIEQEFSYREFLPFLKEFLKKEITVPDREHYAIPSRTRIESTLLTMPAWTVDDYIGLKIVNVFPENKSLPTINGTYILSDGNTGETLTILHGLALTIKRTAAVSALASSFLSKPDASSMLMIGTGNLCHAFIEAHASVRPITTVWVWGRNYEKAKEKASTLDLPNISIQAVQDKDTYLHQADIISAATLSKSPLVIGDKLKEEVYLDLVGSYLKDTREADDNAILGSNIFVDTHSAKTESGDLLIPLSSGVIKDKDILSDLPSLCQNDINRSRLLHPKTFFKSVGFAGPDLAAAIYLFNKIKN